jgi:hypothetical protein
LALLSSKTMVDEALLDRFHFGYVLPGKVYKNRSKIARMISTCQKKIKNVSKTHPGGHSILLA